VTEQLTEPVIETRRPASADVSPSWVVPVALAMIVVQLGFRAWSAFGSGWVGDDLVMMDRILQPGGASPSGLLQGYGSHMMAGALYLTSVITRASPYDFAPAAALMVAMQALAHLGMLRFLVVAFGRRPGILAPLTLYLVSPFAILSTVWWTPGSHHFMVQAALAWAMASQVSYLRTRRWFSALAAVAWVVVGLVFFEKSLLIIGALAFLTVAYFTHGSAKDRLVQVWQSYRISVLANLALGLAFLFAYLHFATVGFANTEAAKTPIGPLVDSMVLRSWVTGIFGGPLTWSDPVDGPTVIAQPTPWLVVACLACLALFVRELVRTRTRSLRGLFLPGYFLACNVLLVAVARASLVGPVIGFEFRYITELTMATAMGLALTTMPVLDAVEPVEVTRPSRLLDDRRRTTLVCAAIAVLALISSVRYVDAWNTGREPSTRWLDHLIADTGRLPRGATVIDAPAPNYVALPFAYPANLVSHLTRPLRADLRFTKVGNESLRATAADGHLGLADVTAVRVGTPSANSTCAHRVDRRGGTTVRLDGPAMFGPWWVRVGYLASEESSLRVSAGGAAYRVPVNRGLHYLFFESGTRPFDRVRISALSGAGVLCTDDVRVGRPEIRPGS
jgi:hypothetical protein